MSGKFRRLRWDKKICSRFVISNMVIEANWMMLYEITTKSSLIVDFVKYKYISTKIIYTSIDIIHDDIWIDVEIQEGLESSWTCTRGGYGWPRWGVREITNVANRAWKEQYRFKSKHGSWQKDILNMLLSHWAHTYKVGNNTNS